MNEIGAEALGICKFCRRALYSTTTHCRSRGYSGGFPIPCLPTDPPCPVEDGTLTAAIAAHQNPARAGYHGPSAHERRSKVTTKNEMIAAIAEKAGKSKADVSAILAAAAEIVASHLKDGQEVVLGDIAKLKVAKREARTGTNPATGEKVQIASKNVVKFKPAKSLADAVA